jgi:hypothetical protein
MTQTFYGYFQEDGRFISDGLLIMMPPRRQAIVNILDEEAVQSKVDCIENMSIIKKVLENALAAEDSVLTDSDWTEMADLRKKTNSGLSRMVSI